MMTEEQKISALTAKINQLGLAYRVAERDLGIDERYVVSLLERLRDVRSALQVSRDNYDAYVLQVDQCLQGDPLSPEFEKQPTLLRLQEALGAKPTE